jgi:hypothetical protein
MTTLAMAFSDARYPGWVGQGYAKVHAAGSQ